MTKAGEGLPNMLRLSSRRSSRASRATTASTSSGSTSEFGEHWRARGRWKELPELEPLIPTADEWAEQSTM